MKIDLVKKIYTKSTVNRINNKNKQFGLERNYDVNLLLTNHLFITLIVFVLGIVLNFSAVISIVLAILYFFFAEYFFFDIRLNKRAKMLEKESPFYFQILSLTLESGDNLRNSIELTCSNIDSNISKEFRKVIEDMQLGKSLNESLDDLRSRIPSDTINNIILNLMESNVYGNNVIESLNRELNYLGDRIVLQTKARINKMPVKISVVSVVIFIPLIMLIILGPILINIFVK